MLDGIYNRPYDIIERQKRYQNDPRPLHRRAPRRILYIRLFSVGFTAGALGTVYGLYQLIQGKPTAA
ncbi:hypothetical protein Moror_16210 [Moniliophthora roreri MCA 2997]|uniref:Uncharacterized protein n=1 Tax=Moniliophthora roreri (strain MCA 2997) TaxID=1381753 RepID=V2X6I1_MONRO|nr:hypothetical protein Moror_16210 [Moniliophthora roreri MCA 2997]KAI3595151.1 hypothetical protein WG66_009399 [Moniliophthora roreri]